MNPWAEDHNRWYARATPAERAAFDASRACPRSKVFTPKLFPSQRAWALFLTRQHALDEVLADTPLPARHEVKGQVRVYEALQDQEKALAGVGRCAVLFCWRECYTVERYRMTGSNGVTSDMFLCPGCARWREIDSLYGVETIAPLPLEEAK